MQKHAISIGSYVLVAAAFSGFVRWIQNQAAFELETGLAIPGTIWGKATFLFCLISIAGIVYLVRRLWYRGLYPAQNYITLIQGEQVWLHRITRSIAGLMIIGAVIAFLIAGYELYSSIVRTTSFFSSAASCRQSNGSNFPKITCIYACITSGKTTVLS